MKGVIRIKDSGRVISDTLPERPRQDRGPPTASVIGAVAKRQNELPLKPRFPLQMTLNHIYLNCASWLQRVLKCL